MTRTTITIRKKAAHLLGASCLAVAALSLSAVAPSSAAFAQEEGRQFDAKSGELVSQAQTQATAGDNQGAVNTLNQALALPDLNPYERSTMYQMLGQYSYELDRPAEALRAFENAINAGGMLPKEIDSITVVIAQLMIGNGQYAEGAQRMENYLNSGGQQKDQYIDLLVQAWVQAEQYQRALPWAEKWFNKASPKERKHFDLLNFLYNNLGMQGRQADIVKQMINRWPEDKNLWDIWASMLANGGREQEAFEVTKMLYLGGALNQESDLMKVVQYYSFYDMPYQAAEILEREMNANRISRTPEKMKQLSGLFRQAREYKRAIPVLEAAASQSGEAKLYADLGEALYNEGQCQKSEQAFNEAINRGYDAGKSWMLIANCRYEETQKLDRLNCKMTDAQMDEAPITKARLNALAAFDRVPASSRERGNAQKWKKFISAEREAVQRRCEFERSVERELCYQNIKLAYDAEVFVGGFELDDAAKCMQYKADYDAEYRVVTTE
jgi:tetratricopeptide (TPR) repeat protein